MADTARKVGGSGWDGAKGDTSLGPGGGADAQDPAPYSYAHGGKDGHPYPVDRSAYDKTIDVLATAVRRARLGQRKGVDSLRRIYGYYDKVR